MRCPDQGAQIRGPGQGSWDTGATARYTDPCHKPVLISAPLSRFAIQRTHLHTQMLVCGKDAFAAPHAKEKLMKRPVLILATLSALWAGAASAVEPALGANLGTSLEDISAALSADGYEMTKYEREGNRIEVYAVKGETRLEFVVNAATGEVTEMETTARRGPNAPAGVSDEQIRTSLRALGYEVTGFERERGEIEVYAMKDGRRWELRIDPSSGDILRTEAED